LETYGAERFTAPPNLTGMPQLSVPCGYDKDGMPVGMQIVTDHWMEDPLLTFANDWGSAFDVRKPEVLPC
ncbi:MAG: amidase family protein, partial [Methanomassiliicoccaceae archaeon]|nr:amidase family protein [Methanomassiliicoccaceae archaeon]